MLCLVCVPFIPTGQAKHPSLQIPNVLSADVKTHREAPLVMGILNMLGAVSCRLCVKVYVSWSWNSCLKAGSIPKVCGILNICE